MKTRDWTVHVNGVMIQLDDVEGYVSSIFPGSSFRELLEAFGLVKEGTHLRIEHKSYYVKDDNLFNYVELTNVDTGIKYYGSVRLCVLNEDSAPYTFFYGEGTN